MVDFNQVLRDGKIDEFEYEDRLESIQDEKRKLLNEVGKIEQLLRTE